MTNHHFNRIIQTCFVLSFCLLFTGCFGPEKEYERVLPAGVMPLKKVQDPREVHNLAHAFKEAHASMDAVDQSLHFFSKPSSKTHFPYSLPDRQLTHADQIASLEAYRDILIRARNANEFASMIWQQFDIYQSVGWDGKSGEVLFTAYYTPILEGRLQSDSKFKYPLYRRPGDLVTNKAGKPQGRRQLDGSIVPYYTRGQIDNHKILHGQELVYLSNPFDAYLVHVQGSASILLENGDPLHVGYAGKTDQPYVSIGKELIERKEIRKEDMSLKKLREFFNRYPHRALDILPLNPNFVFFQESAPGPFGSIGVKVTDRHTIATDKNIFPRGGLVMVDTVLPQANAHGRVAAQPHTSIYLDQDTGGAIRSAGRADLYIGKGKSAEDIAGHVRNEGRMFYLFLKPQLMRQQ